MGMPLAQAKPKKNFLSRKGGGAGSKEMCVGWSGEPTRRPNSLKETSGQRIDQENQPRAIRSKSQN